MADFSPYLLFSGNCADAMQFYQSIFGGELTLIKVSDTPMKKQLPITLHSKIINARLTGDLIHISASDWLHPTRIPRQGNTVCLYISGGSYKKLQNYFAALSEGADQTVLDPLTEKFYGAYGALTDKYGIRWMFQTDLQK